MTFFKTLGKTLGLQLRSNELEAIDKEIRDLPPNVCVLYKDILEYRREAYILMHAAQAALTIAQCSHSTQAQWLEALHRAKQADKLIQPLIELKFQTLVLPNFNSILLVPLAALLTPTYVTTKEAEMFLLLFLVQFIPRFMLASKATELTPILSSSMTECVLDAAKMRNITLYPAKKVTPDPAKKVTPDPAKKVTPDPAKKVTPDPVKNVTPDPVKNVYKEEQTKKYTDLFVFKQSPLNKKTPVEDEDIIEDNDVSDEMMLHSAFGQGSNTYKARRGYK